MTLTVSSLTPSCLQLMNEGIAIARSGSSDRLRLGLINLMPDKATTERHWLRLLGATGLDLEVELLALNDWQPKTTPVTYLQQHYSPWSTSKADVFIVTGAPLGLVPDQKVGYWAEMEKIFNSLTEQRRPVMYLCWAANTALTHFYQLPRVVHNAKLSGVFEHAQGQAHPLLQNLPAKMQIPHSRYAEADAQMLARQAQLKVLIKSDDAGNCLITDDAQKRLFLLGHPEYEADTLAKEYQRDRAKDSSIAAPTNYFTGPAGQGLPQPVWQQYGQQLLKNWLRHYQN